MLAAAHIGPTVAVTVLSTGLALAAALPADRCLLLVAAVLTGQLSIGWSNDLADLSRDRASKRRDKPLATGEAPEKVARAWCGVALAATVTLSLALGWQAGLAHLTLVASGWAYNLGLKATVWSWAPYALGFGALPVSVWLARQPPEPPAWWVPAVGAALGVGAHLVNALPDLADDAATGIKGLPHRLGARRSVALATGLLVAASALALGVAPPDRGPLTWTGLAVVGGLGLVALTGSGRTPFRAAVGIALADVLVLAAVL